MNTLRMAMCFSRRLSLFIFLLGFVFCCLLFMFHYSEQNGKHVVYNTIQSPAEVRSVNCGKEKKRFWGTHVANFRSGNFNPSCIIRNPMAGYAEATPEEFFVPQNFKDMPKCKPVSVDYYPEPHPKVALASFSGSGNTWSRHLIEQMSGIHTGSVFCGFGPDKTVFKAECAHHKHNYTIVIKTHASVVGHFQKFDRAVLILRNPYDALFADYNRHKAGRTTTITASELNSTNWRKRILLVAPAWHQHAASWLRYFRGPVHILSYEGLINNFFGEMYKLANFLNVSVTFADLWCVKNNGEGLYHREKKLEPVYNTEQRQLIDKLILDLKPLVRERCDVELPF